MNLQVIQNAKKENCYKIVLHCAKHNGAFYEKLGFYHSSFGMRYNIL